MDPRQFPPVNSGGLIEASTYQLIVSAELERVSAGEFRRPH